MSNEGRLREQFERKRGKMNRRTAIQRLATFFLTTASLAQAQQPKKVYRIGYLWPRPGIDFQEEAFLQRLRELGYIEGQNIVIEWRTAKGQANLLPKLAAELVRLKVDCILAVGVDATHAAKQATNTIPIVMGNADVDPVQLGLVASLAQPGGNITGVTSISSDLAGKRLELLKETVPKASRMAILSRSQSRAAAGHVKETEVAARALAVQLQSVEVRDAEALENAFRVVAKGRAEALIILGIGGMSVHRARILEFAVKSRLPVMYSNPDYVVAGGLMSYAADLTAQFRRAATHVDKILKGTKPADIPVERPMKFELVFNLKAAKQIGLTIPPNVLVRADRVIR